MQEGVGLLLADTKDLMELRYLAIQGLLQVPAGPLLLVKTQFKLRDIRDLTGLESPVTPEQRQEQATTVSATPQVVLLTLVDTDYHRRTDLEVQKFDTSNDAVGVKKCYVDNPYNRKVGRVGLPVGSLVIHKNGNHDTKKKQKHKKLLEECSLEDVIQLCMRAMTLEPNDGYQYVDYQYAADRLQRDEVEEEWKKNKLEPSNVDVSKLTSHYPEVLIPFENLQLEGAIGRGGFGEVHAACLQGEPVAFKKLLYQRISRRRMDSFIKEVTILSAID